MIASGHFWPFFAGQGHPVCWSNPMQTTGQVECKWVVKSMQLRRGVGKRVTRVRQPVIEDGEECLYASGEVI
ncbi:hypothetical protein CXB41_16970 [Pseudomonas syringae pv. syringae]|nr:hypothetical protein CXB41_16970 [Pseudomonas syringae pv. syringae]